VVVRTARFLVVDDDPVVARHLVRVVRPFGEAVVASTVRDARNALASFAAWRALFVDLGLPDGLGLDVLDQAQLAQPDVPAMVLTGSVEPDLINAVHDRGAGYVVKPVDGARIERFCRNLPPSAPARPVTQRRFTRALPGTLAGCVDRLRELLPLRLDPLARYAMGAIIAGLKADPDRYGKGAVAAAAAAIGEDAHGLYRHATIAESWAEAEVRELCMRRGRDGCSLSWSHLALLGSVQPAEAREALAERALDEGLSVRQLTAIVTDRAQPAPPARRQGGPQP
jgi:CheY-like chemotaxis protein